MVVSLNQKCRFLGLSPSARRLTLTFRSTTVAKFFFGLGSVLPGQHVFKGGNEGLITIFTKFQTKQANNGIRKRLKQDPALLLYSIELADPLSSFDTISLSPSLLWTGRPLIELLDEVSFGKAFNRPCTFRYNSSSCDVSWELPSWMVPTDLLSIVGAILERTLWLAYAISCASIERAPYPALREAESLTNLWKLLNAKQRGEILLAVQREPGSMLAAALIKEGIEKPEVDIIGKLMFLPLKDLGSCKGCKYALELIRSCGWGLATPVLNQILSVKPRQKLEFSAFEDELVNTSISTQISGKSKCGSRRGSTDDSIVSAATFWMYGEDDYEIVSIRTTGKIVAGILDKLGEDAIGTESELDFFAELEKEIEKTKASSTELEPVVKECDIIKVFWGNSKKKCKKELKIFEREECRTPKESSKPLVELESPPRMRKPQIPTSLVEGTQKTENRQDGHFMRNQCKITAKKEYDYLKTHWLLHNFLGSKVTTSSIKAQFQAEKAIAIQPKPFATLSQQISSVLIKLYKYQISLEPYRKLLINTLSKAIQRCFAPKKIEVEVYGSAKNGLAIEKSDIDLRLVGLDISKITIKGLEKKIRCERYIKSTTSILTARVPVIKLVRTCKIKEQTADYEALVDDFPEDGVEQFQKVDITVEEEKGYAKKTVDFAINLLNTIPCLKAVVVILKKLLDINELNIPFSGNFASLKEKAD
eukprot:TRINITY_DN7305_c0_g1_i2.p1 TRINITY_DN7305_c0_g1~~TRINITY_DN7305_c0_g1_i2.p1  ORF type:complete len:706 (+),score=59.20 TRINITY_DN7305_c0_g1_i2:361-2478(+)